MKLEDILASDSIAHDLPEEMRIEIANKVVEWYDEDVKSRADWERKYEQWMKLASQTLEHKSTPWPNAANIKYPLIVQAALNYNSRVMPALMPNMKPVGIQPIGDDPEGLRQAEANKVNNHMNYQLNSEIEDWEEGHDRMSIVQAITGQEYKKTYFSLKKGRMVSEFVSSADLVLHYWYNDFESTRKTHKLPMSYNDMLGEMRSGRFLEYTELDLGGKPTTNNDQLQVQSDERHGFVPGRPDDATDHLLIDHHGWYDLDEDGYAEPYRITVHYQSKKLLEIVPRFVESDVIKNDMDEVMSIKPIEYFTKYGFIPNPDGSNYDVGFGTLLTPINAMVNSTANMMMDAGTLANMQSGFIGKGIRLKGGTHMVQPGKWLVVNASGSSLKDNVVPLPIKEPSNVLLQLMQFMIQAGKELSFSTDIFNGQHPGQNTKVGVTQSVISEGMKTFNAIYKRQRRALKKEMQKLFRLNGLILEAEYPSITVSNAKLFGVEAAHYNTTQLALEPSADPATAIKEQKVNEEMGVLQLASNFGGNVQEALKRVYIALEVPNWEAIMQVPEQGPSEELLIEKAKLQLEQDKQANEFTLKSQELKLKLAEILIKDKEADGAIDFNIAKVLTDFGKLENDRQIAKEKSTNAGTANS